VRFAIMPVLLALIVGSGFAAEAKEYSIGVQEESKRIDAKVLDSPSPEIPSEMKDEAFKTGVTARFNIAADGKVAVALLSSSGNEDIDKIVLDTLKKWKFQPATVNNEPVASSRKLKIELEVE
jgi:TonB family protein